MKNKNYKINLLQINKKFKKNEIYNQNNINKKLNNNKFSIRNNIRHYKIKCLNDKDNSKI